MVAAKFDLLLTGLGFQQLLRSRFPVTGCCVAAPDHHLQAPEAKDDRE